MKNFRTFIIEEARIRGIFHIFSSEPASSFSSSFGHRVAYGGDLKPREVSVHAHHDHETGIVTHKFLDDKGELVHSTEHDIMFSATPEGAESGADHIARWHGEHDVVGLGKVVDGFGRDARRHRIKFTVGVDPTKPAGHGRQAVDLEPPIRLDRPFAQQKPAQRNRGRDISSGFIEPADVSRLLDAHNHARSVINISSSPESAFNGEESAKEGEPTAIAMHHAFIHTLGQHQIARDSPDSPDSPESP